MTTVLCIRAGVAHWTRWHQGSLCEQFSEHYLQSQTTSSSATACPWLKDKTTDVHLLVDCAVEEVETIPLTSSGSSWSGWADKRALGKSLRMQHPDTEITFSKPQAHTRTFTLLHRNWAPELQEWLLLLLDQHLRIVSAQSVSGLLASVFQGNGKDVMLLLSAGGETRHLLCRQGCVFFTRVTSASGTNDELVSLQESLDYLQSRSILQSDLAVKVMGMSEASASRITKLATVSTLEVIDRTVDAESTPAESNSLAAAEESVGFDAVARYASELLIRNKGISSSIETDRFLENKRQHRTGQKLKFATVVTMAIASYTVIMATASVIDGQNQIEQHELRMSNYSSSIVKFRNNAQLLAEEPELVASSIERARILKAVMAPKPLDVMGRIAEAYTRYPHLQLEFFSWVSVDDVELLRQEGFRSDVGSRPSRRFLPNDESTHSALQVTLGGSLTPSLQLRERQAEFTAFVEYLQLMPTVSRVEIELSPIDVVSNAGQVTGKHRLAGNGKSRIDYELKLLFRAAQS